jgi:epoxyqueuosine reductase
MSSPSLQQVVQQYARDIGFHLSGIAPVTLVDQSSKDISFANRENPDSPSEQSFPELSGYAQWVAEGRAGEMEYLKRRDSAGHLLRSSMQIPFPWARSVIVCAVNYNSDQPYSIDLDTANATENMGWIARYAWSGREQPSPSMDETVPASFSPTDYHSVIRERLEQLCAKLTQAVGNFEARCFVDTGPLVERVYAKYAGLGWQGKNTCMIHESLGSWFFLGVIITSLDLPREDWTQPMPDRCGSCTRCIDACPTEALVPYRMDASRCIAYLTIEKRGPIPEDLVAKVGRNVFGCDICQEVCPWNRRGNRRAPITNWPELQPRPELVNPALDWLASLNEVDYRRMFRHSPVERAKLRDFQRNVANAQKNASLASEENFASSTQGSDRHGS